MLKTVAVLPSLATLCNLLCGLGAVYFCLLSVRAAGSDLSHITLNNARMDNFFPTYLAIAAYLLAAAMLFDGIDGRLARFARKTSEFGGQLDSLSDVVSFGVAPAMLVLCIAMPANIPALTGPERLYWRAEWVMAATYTCCAALRLARFNVENVEDESAHMGFRGLPSPGAAAAIMGLVILHQDLLKGLAAPWMLRVLASALPPIAMVLGLLMVSRFPYLHMMNAIVRGRRPFRQVVAIVIVGMIGLIVQFQATIAVAAMAYALSGPILKLIARARGRRMALAEAAVDAPAENWTEATETFTDTDDEAPDADDSEPRTHRNRSTG